jgi:hypothetical protein
MWAKKVDCNDKAKPAERRGRKATGPRSLREATERLPEGPKIAGLPSIHTWQGHIMKNVLSLIIVSGFLAASGRLKALTLPEVGGTVPRARSAARRSGQPAQQALRGVYA